MPSKQEHLVSINSGGGAVPALRPHSIAVCLEVDLAPRFVYEVKSEEVVFVVPVVASKDIHAVLVNYC